MLLRLIVYLLTFSLCACAPRMAHLETVPQNAIADNIIITMNPPITDSADARNLMRAYATAFADLDTPYTAHLLLNARWEQSVLSPWYLGCLILGPFWPAQPRVVEMSIELEARIHTPSGALYRIYLVEQEKLERELFWFGPYRQKPLRRAVDLLHRKLIARLNHQIAQMRQPVDQGIATDAIF